MSDHTEEQAQAAKDGAVPGGSSPSIDLASATVGVRYSVNSQLLQLEEDVKARENQSKAKIEELLEGKSRMKEEIETLKSDKLELENKVRGLEGSEKGRIESQQKAAALEEQNKELEGQVERLLAANKSFEENRRIAQSLFMSPKNDATVDTPTATGAEGVDPTASLAHQAVDAPKVDAAPSSNLEEDDDGFVTAPEGGPEASGEIKAGEKAGPTLQVICEKQESGDETGASNGGGDGKASPSSMTSVEAEEISGEEVESKARAEPQESEDDADAANLKPCPGVELTRTTSEKKKKWDEAKERASKWNENRKKRAVEVEPEMKTPQRTKRRRQSSPPTTERRRYDRSAKKRSPYK